MRRSFLFAGSVSSLLALLLTHAGCDDSTPGPFSEEDGGGTRDGAGADSNDGDIADGGPSVTIDGQSVSIAESALERTLSVSDVALDGAVTANNAFAVDLYAQFRASSASQNLLTSPVSASLALTMTYAGAKGATATQMATAMHYGDAAGTIFDGQNALSQALAARGPDAFMTIAALPRETGTPKPSAIDYQLQVVNSVWGQYDYTWNASFLNILAEDYGTGVYLQDFKSAPNPARLLINDWVSSETANKINDLIPEMSIDVSTRMVIVNAIHLKFPWAHTFSTADTATADFATAKDTTVSTPFMNQTGSLPYVDDGTAQIVGLPLANQELAVVIALPHGDLATYEASLTATSAGIKMPVSGSLVQLSVPKVSFTSPTFSLLKALQAMGMTAAFDVDDANFTGLCSQPPNGDVLYISDVLQKAEIGMEESGVEAAAATAVIVDADGGASVGPPPSPIPMIVNRPYVVSIVDVPTGAVLFLGHIVDPTRSGS
jgi:serpin B